MPRLNYREATERDVPALARIRSATWGTESYWLERITGYMRRESRAVYLASDVDEVVGLIAGHLTRRFECDGELEWIDVIEPYRRRGIASALLRQLAAWFVAQQAHLICVDVAPDNIAAQRLYRSHGAEDLRPHWLVWRDIAAITAQK